MCLTKYVTTLSKKDFNMFGNEFLVYHLSKMCLSQFLFYLTLQYCIGFAIYQNESATGIHVLPILDPLPSSLPIPSLWVVPVYQPQASSIVHQAGFRKGRGARDQIANIRWIIKNKRVPEKYLFLLY